MCFRVLSKCVCVCVCVNGKKLAWLYLHQCVDTRKLGHISFWRPSQFALCCSAECRRRCDQTNSQRFHRNSAPLPVTLALQEHQEWPEQKDTRILYHSVLLWYAIIIIIVVILLILLLIIIIAIIMNSSSSLRRSSCSSSSCITVVLGGNKLIVQFTFCPLGVTVLI